MTVEERVRNRLDQLIEDGGSLAARSNNHGQVLNEGHKSECVGWIAAAVHLVSLVCPNATDPYRDACAHVVSDSYDRTLRANEYVGQLVAILKRLTIDMDNGLVTSVVATASAETLDDLLDQAREYHRRRHKEGAGILATAVFEDTIRRIARMTDISDADVKTDIIVSELVKKQAITSVVAKRCRAASGVRNHALHAQWDDFTLDDIEDVIRLTDRLLVVLSGG